MKTLAELRAELKKALEKAAGLKAAAKAAGAKPEDKEAYKAALLEVDGLTTDIEELEEEERVQARASKAAGAPAGTGTAEEDETESEGNALWAEVKTDDRPQFVTSLLAAAHARAKYLHGSGVTTDTIKVLREEGYDRFADDMLKQQQRRARTEGRVLKTNSTLTPQDGGVLLPTPNSASIMPMLRNENTFFASNPRRIQLVGGRFNMPIQTGHATAGYIGEGAKKPVGSPTFGSISMSSKKIAGIVMLTEEVLKWSLANIRAFVETDLRDTMGQNIDTAMFFGAGTATVPWGIFQRDAMLNLFDGSSTSLFADPTAPTLEELDAIGDLMLLAITDRNIRPKDSFQWSMNYHLLSYLRRQRGNNDMYVYPELQGENPRWKGFRVRPTNAIPNNGGATTDESILALVDWSEVWFGEEEDITVRTSTEATIDPGTGVLVGLFQQNMMAVLMEARHDVGLGRPGAISVLRKARWGALAG